MLETLVIQGGAVKAMGDGKIGGYLVTFGSERQHDLARDYFTPETSYDVDAFPAKTGVYYHHGLDPEIKAQKVASGDMTQTDLGIWVDTQLALRTNWEKAVYKMAEEGKLGWSSGVPSHLVERKAVGNAFEITHWPLGIDASLTPAPCEPRSLALPIKAMSLKAWAVEQHIVSVKSLFDDRDIPQDLTFGAISRLEDLLWYEVYDAIYDYDGTGGDSLDALRATFDQFRDFALDVIEALMKLSVPEMKTAAAEVKSRLIRARAAEVKTEREFEGMLRDAGFSRSQAVAITARGYKSSRRDEESSRTVQRDADDGLSDLLAGLKAAAAALTI